MRYIPSTMIFFITTYLCYGSKDPVKSKCDPNVGYNRKCQFPFEYRGKTYHECTAEDNNGILWCLTTKGKGDWTNCKSKCSLSNECWEGMIGRYVQEGHGQENECYLTLDEAQSKCIAAGDCKAVATQNNVCSGMFRVTHGGPTFVEYENWQQYDLKAYEYLCFKDEDTEKKCENKETWCEAAKPDCKTDVAKESCPKYCDVCKKVDGGFSEWDEWTACTVECGGGDQTRSRRCDNPVPEFGGSECDGDFTECQRCNMDPCPSSCPA